MIKGLIDSLRQYLYNFICPIINNHLNKEVQKGFDQLEKNYNDRDQSLRKFQLEMSDCMKRNTSTMDETANQHKEFMERLDKIISLIKKEKENEI